MEENRESSRESLDCDKVIEEPQRGPLVFDQRAILRSPLRFLRVSGPLLTAHHPLCSEYDGHVLKIGKRKFCFGCFFNSIFFLTSLAILLILWLSNSLFFDRFLYFYLGVGTIVSSFILSISGATENRKVKALGKVFLGSGFAFVVFSILIAGGTLFAMLIEKALTILILYIPVMTLLNAKRAYDIEKDCKECMYKMRWSKCPGFKPLICRYIEEGFIYAKEPRSIDK